MVAIFKTLICYVEITFNAYGVEEKLNIWDSVCTFMFNN